MGRFFDKEMGWGDIVMESDSYIIVRWDSDPSCYEQIPMFY